MEDAFELALLLDYYGSMLTDKQKECFDMRYNQSKAMAWGLSDATFSRASNIVPRK